MKFEYNNPVLKLRRRELRNKATDTEKILWQKLQRKQLRRHKFVRQYSVGPYILDFYCPKARLAIELDGFQHDSDEGKIYDQERTNYLATCDIKVIRFWNKEILSDLEKVISRIAGLLPPS